MPEPILTATYELIARNLREFGYPDAEASMIREVHEAMKENRDLPHGVIGMFAKSQLKEVEEQGLKI